jgi:ATP-binding cassette subfamily B protein
MTIHEPAEKQPQEQGLISALRERKFKEVLKHRREQRKTRKGMRAAFKHLPKIFPYLKRYWYLLALAIVFTAISGLAGVAEPWPLAFLVDSVLGNEPVPGWIPDVFVGSTGGLILLAVASGLAIAFVMNSIHVINEYVQTKLAEKMVLDFRSDLFQHVQRLSLAFHSEHRRGSLMFAINSQANTMGEITVALLPLAEGAIMLLGMFVVAYKIDSQLALLSLTVVPFIYSATGYYGKRIDPELRRVRGLESMSMSIVYEAMSMIRVILAFGRENYEHRRFRNQGEDAVDARVRLTIRQTGFSLAVNVITAAGTALVLWVGARHVLDRDLTVGQLLIIMSYIASVYKPLEQISTTFANLQEQLISLEAATDLLASPADVEDPPDGISAGRAKGDITFEKVSFNYKSRKGTLSDVSFDVKAGSVVALVGPTGAGKSTLVGLIPRFMDPQEGRILIDGTDIKQLQLESLRSQISLVLQEPLLFSGTILENIRYGRLDATDEEVYEAARAAGAHDFISKLPNKYKTVLGEGGAQISGGERQRVCIARAFVRDAPILILDEPTSSVDSKTEGAILQALQRLMVGRTTFLIAHRLGTIRHADTILVINDGRVIQQGSHAELAGQEGLYRELLDAQGMLGARDIAPAQLTDMVAAPQAPEPEEELVPAKPVPVRAPEPIRGPALYRPKSPNGVRRPKVVILGMASKIPVPGVLWQTIHYLVGFEKLGFDAYYVEAHGRTPSMLMNGEGDDSTVLAAGMIDGMMRSIGMGNRWAFHALHDDGRCLGISLSELNKLYRDAALIINLHGGTIPTEEQAAGGRLVYVETDPVEVQIQLHDRVQSTVDYLEPHAAFFTFAENYGNPDCLLPVSKLFEFVPTCQPVVLDFWPRHPAPSDAFRTVGSWRQVWRDVTFRNEVYSWSKHHEFRKFLSLPVMTGARFELAMAALDDEDRALLTGNGWAVLDPQDVSQGMDSYREFVSSASGEFTVAKDQNVRMRTGWFSDRSATFLAAGRPVVTQQTGFSNVIATGTGLIGFSTPEEAAEAVRAVRSDPKAHSRAALDIAREHFSSDVVLKSMLDHLGFCTPSSPRSAGGSVAFNPSIDLLPASRKPMLLRQETVRAVEAAPPAVVRALVSDQTRPRVSIVIPLFGQLPLVKLCLQSVLHNTAAPMYELVIVDNGAPGDTAQYVDGLVGAHPGIRVIRNAENLGFAGAVNQGVEAARAGKVVLLNDDTIVPPGWLDQICARLDDPKVGAVGPVTNRSEDEAEIPASYRTYGEFLDCADRRARRHRGRVRKVSSLTMFCFAFRKATFAKVGSLDTEYGLGLFEDDDYCRVLTNAGYKLVTAEDVLVHHFGGSSFGSLVPSGKYAELFDNNRRRFEDKWGTWKTHARRPNPGYRRTTERLQRLVSDEIPSGDAVAVVSRGDDALLELPVRSAQHFPQMEDGSYPGFYPVDGDEAVAHLEQVRGRGAAWLVIPRPAFWWLEHYQEFSRHLESTYLRAVDDEECRIYRLEPQPAAKTVAGNGRSPR